MTVLFTGSLGAAFLRSNVSTIVLYNETDQPLLHVRIQACGQGAAFSPLPENGSVRLRLKASGHGSPITLDTLETTEGPARQWVGSYVEPRAGYRTTLRIYPNNQIEAHTQTSWWRRVILREASVEE